MTHLSPHRFLALILLPFGLAYFLSYALRNVNALLAGTLMTELAIGPTELGLLTGVLFLAMAIAQIPLGMALDRYGPWRVQPTLLLAAAAGAVTTSLATSFVGLFLGRVLIGIGTSASLMAGLKAVLLTSPPERIARSNGILIMVGAFGAVAVTAPAESLVTLFGWRGLFQGAAGIFVILAVLIAVIVPKRRQQQTREKSARVKFQMIYTDARFLALAPLSALTIGVSWSLQGLWAAPWFMHVAKLDHALVVHHLLVIGIALAVGAAGLGWMTDRLHVRGYNREVVLVAAAGASLAAMVALTLQFPVPALIPWSVIAVAGAATTVSYAILPGYFAAAASGRANAALNLLHLVTAFAVQAAIGAFIERWPQINGHPPPAAYEAALGIVAGLQALALVWFAWARRPRTVPVLTVRHPLLRALDTIPVRMRGDHYDRALASFAERVRTTRTETGHWRRAALSLATLCVMLTGLLTTMNADDTRPFVVAIDDIRFAEAGDAGHARGP